MNVAFFSFTEADREDVKMIKGRALNPNYFQLRFKVQDLIKPWNTVAPGTIRQAISKSMRGTSRTIVFVGGTTYTSRWVAEEVAMTLIAKKPVYAIRLKGKWGPVPSCLLQNGITVHTWSEANLQRIATQVIS